MSQRRSGLLAGLIVGFFAMLVGGTGVAAGVYYSDRLPDVVSTADGVPLLGALAVLAGLVVALAVRAVRPRGLLLPPLAALYAGLAFGTGTLVGAAPHAIPHTLPLIVGQTKEPPPALPSVDEVRQGLSSLLPLPAEASITLGVLIGIAALVAFLLVALKVRKVRRRERVQAGVTEPVVVEEEPEYRAPFEPAQAPTQQTTTDMFTPRKPTQ